MPHSRLADGVVQVQEKPASLMEHLETVLAHAEAEVREIVSANMCITKPQCLKPMRACINMVYGNATALCAAFGLPNAPSYASNLDSVTTRILDLYGEGKCSEKTSLGVKGLLKVCFLLQQCLICACLRARVDATEQLGAHAPLKLACADMRWQPGRGVTPDHAVQMHARSSPDCQQLRPLLFLTQCPQTAPLTRGATRRPGRGRCGRT